MNSESKSTSGFHMLMILSRVDGNFSEEESEIAARYISKYFGNDFQIEKEAAFLKLLTRKNYFQHFKKCMNNFYSKSSAHDRAEFVKFAIDMVKADHKITSEENVYLNELLAGWEPEHSG
jgi:uncharacterized tellurite resistance protein B-like protein